MKRKEYLLNLIETIDELKEESKKGVPILVEGKRT
jgi:2,5-diamino-6-(ribosylamino)-4(3H)-pyrimidinone 5'-phosphate reductase